MNFPFFCVFVVVFCALSTASGCEPPACREACRDGYVRDNNGCDTCECIDVCQDHTCEFGTQCVPVEQACGGNCPRVAACMAHTCLQVMDSGSCRDRVQRWFFDTLTMQCDVFQYGGCGGNDNNFLTLAECNEACAILRDVPLDPHCEALNCSLACSYGYKKDTLGCDMCECQPKHVCPVIDCDLSCQHGKVKDNDGCDLCACNLLPICPELTHCNKSCTYGLMKDDSNCDICQCNDLCQDITCPSGHQCDQESTECMAEFCKPSITCRPDLCFLEPLTGMCRAGFPRWFFNPSTDTCQRFTYGGCRGNANNFHTEDECQSSCAGIPSMPNCPTVMCDMEPCEHGLKTNAHGCEVCECYEPPACTAIDTCDLSCTFGFELDENDCPICSCNNPCQDTDCVWGEMCDVVSDCTTTPCTYHAQCRQQLCFLPPVKGLCRAMKERWYFNPGNDTCKVFMYGGCRGNPNNFVTQSECLEACNAEPAEVQGCNPTMCLKSCYHGFKKDEAGCDLCECQTNDIVCPDMSGCNRTCALSGFVVNSGCKQCQCNEPCEDHACGADEECIEEITECSIPPCLPEPRCVPLTDSTPAICLLPRQVGPCRAMVRRWYYNTEIGKCQTFLYGGCDGNDNRFVTRDECLNTCVSGNTVTTTVCPPVDCPESCSLGLNKEQDSSGCITHCTCQCPPPQCEFPCTFGYLKDTEGCDICSCVPPPCPTCPVGECSYGHMKGEEGCDRCGQCFNPCMDYQLCGTGEKCVSKLFECEEFDSCESETMLRPVCVKENKAGRCPAITTVPQLPDTCSNDAECPEIDKCCRDQEGSQSCITPDYPMACMEVPVSLPCSPSEKRWYFDKEKGECLTFKDSEYGCDTPYNRFPTKDACDWTCAAVYTFPPPDVPLPRCEFGHKTDQYGRPTPICKDDPCWFTDCAYGYMCQHVPQEVCTDPMDCPLTAACVSKVNKTGICPRSDRWLLTDLCLDMCSDDSQCAGNQKCCGTGCGRICIHPQQKDSTLPDTQCRQHHQKSLTSLQIDPMNPTFVPVCDRRGLYEVIQCNLHLGVCWCVDPYTGVTMHGSETHGVPDCTGTLAAQSENMEMCPGGTAVRRCDPLQCDHVDCPGHRDAICRVNPCSDRCTLDFYDSFGRKITDQDCQRGITSCHKEKAILMQKMGAMMTKEMQYSEQSSKDFTEHFMRLLEKNERQMMVVYHKRQQDLNAPERPNGRPLPTRRIERGMPEEIPVTAAPGGSRRGMPENTDATPTQGQGTPAYPNIPPVSHEPLPQSNMYIPQCRSLYNHVHGGYQYKQCTVQFCWCVDHNNQPIAGTLTDSRGILTCSQQGRVVSQSTDVVSCTSGNNPRVCTSDFDTMCLGVPGVVHRMVDPCDNCSLTLYTEDWKPVNIETCKVEPDAGVCRCERCEGWEYDQSTDQCIQMTYSGVNLMYPGYILTQQHCNMACKEMSCPAGNSEYMCTDACHNATCPFFPEAVCMTDVCTCTPYFMDPVTSNRVNCNQGTDVCTRYEAVVTQMEMTEEWTTSEQEQHTICQRKGTLVEDIKSLQLTVKFDNDISLIASPDKMDAFQSSVRSAVAKMLQVAESLIDVLKVIEGSIITVVEVREVDEDIMNRIDMLHKWVIDGHLASELGGDFILDEEPFSVEYIYQTSTSVAEVTSNGRLGRGEGETVTEGIRAGDTEELTTLPTTYPVSAIESTLHTSVKTTTTVKDTSSSTTIIMEPITSTKGNTVGADGLEASSSPMVDVKVTSNSLSAEYSPNAITESKTMRADGRLSTGHMNPSTSFTETTNNIANTNLEYEISTSLDTDDIKVQSSQTMMIEITSSIPDTLSTTSQTDTKRNVTKTHKSETTDKIIDDIIVKITTDSDAEASTKSLIDDIAVKITSNSDADNTKTSSVKRGTTVAAVTAAPVVGRGLSRSDTAILVVACLFLVGFLTVLAVALLISRNRKNNKKTSRHFSSYPSSENGIMENEDKASISSEPESPGDEKFNGISYA